MIAVITVLILLVVLVNGWTDAPNAIAGCVSTRSMSPSSALVLASVCNFTGAVGMALISPRVAETLYNIVDLGSDGKGALYAIAAGLAAVILWATLAWRFGLPTSESHALISGITGAAIAERMSLDAINLKEWALVLTGLFATTLPPFVLGYVVNKLLCFILRGSERRRTMLYFSRAQKLSAAVSALLHGAQDSQKFMGIYMLALSLGSGGEVFDGNIPIGVVLICASVMTLGTALGGARIIKKVGCDMTDLDAAGGSASDIASSAVLFICSLLGIPASTTHSKSCAIMGTGFCKRGGVDLRIVSQMLAAWGLTFPVCAALGFIFSLLMSALFQ
ncbi:MAG: inorganic phosphate transporter [Clostridia bacterium]|nr:inorganic phosphate transporter [Clostridia bacterium]